MWEHKVVKPESYEIEIVQKTLDEAGKKGWELVSVADDVGGELFYLFFKRKVS